MIDMEIAYPEGTNTTHEEREFDSFLLNYIIEQATKQRSPKVRIEPEHIDKLWQEYIAMKSATH